MKRYQAILLMAVFMTAAGAIGLMGEGKLSGLIFGDYYYVLGQHNEALEKFNGFWLRRVYFTYDNTLTPKISMRFRLEANSPGDFKTATTLVPFIKDAYLAHRLGKHTLMLGLIGTPLYDNLDEYWGFRPMEKTPIDLFRFGNSRDFGVGLKGALDARQRLTYTVIFGNGDGLKSELGRGKAVYGRLNFQPTKALFLELYADYTDTGPGSSVNVFQAFTGVRGDWGRTGLNFGYRHADLGDYGADLKFISFFGVCKLSPKLELVGRFDRLLDPQPAGSRIAYIPMADNEKANVLLAGLGWSLNENVKVIPNLKYVFYDTPENGEKSAADLYAYLTLYFRF